ncbi:MAG: phosphoribosyltransferase family protein [archaeon]
MVDLYRCPKDVRDGAFKIAKFLYNSGVKPTITFGVARGGMTVALPIHEYFKYMYDKTENDVVFGIIGAGSYEGKEQKDVKVYGWVPELKQITEKDRILLIDDIIDQRTTMQTLVETLEKETPLRRDFSKPLRERQIIVISDCFKDKPEFKHLELGKPDVYSLLIEPPMAWVQFLSHEMIGLEPETIKERYRFDV